MATTDKLESSDERLIAALAYFFGALAAFIVWVIYKDRSRFVRFHAVQALVASMLLMVFGFIFSMCLFPVMFGGIMLGTLSIGENLSRPNFFFPFFAPMISFVFFIPFAFIAWGIRLWGTIGVFVNPNFHYPILGRWVENFLKE